MGAVTFAPQACCAVGVIRTQRAKHMNRRWICPVAALAALVMLASSATARTLNGFELKGSLVPPDQILHGGPPKDPNPGDRRAQVRLAERCCARCRRTGARPRPQRGGESVPGRILNWHEIVNDRLGDEPTSIMNTVFFVSATRSISRDLSA